MGLPVNDTFAQLAVADAGITCLASFVAAPLIKNGQLQAIFCTQASKKAVTCTDTEALDFHVCYRDRRELTLKMCAFIDYLFECMLAIQNAMKAGR